MVRAYVYQSTPPHTHTPWATGSLPRLEARLGEPAPFPFDISDLHTPGGYSDIFIICMRGSFFGVQNFEFQNFRGVFRKKKLGYEDFVDIFWGSSQIGLYLGVISMLFRVFS